MISGRSAVQCGAKYRKSSKCRDDIVDGSWLEIDERRLFLGAVVYEIPTSSTLKKTDAEIEAFLNDEMIIPTLARTTGLISTSHGEDGVNNITNNSLETIIIQKEKKKYIFTKGAPTVAISPAPVLVSVNSDTITDSTDIITNIEGQDVGLLSATAKVKNDMITAIIKKNYHILLNLRFPNDIYKSKHIFSLSLFLFFSPIRTSLHLFFSLLFILIHSSSYSCIYLSLYLFSYLSRIPHPFYSFPIIERHFTFSLNL